MSMALACPSFQKLGTYVWMGLMYSGVGTRVAKQIYTKGKNHYAVNVLMR